MAASSALSGSSAPPSFRHQADSDDAFPNAEALEALGVSELLPGALLSWRPLVSEALLAFLRGLPAARLDEIVERQFALGMEASPAQRLTALLACCPTLHKLGQVVARQPHLHGDLRAQLRMLESMRAITPMDGILRRLRSELGADVRRLAIDEAALAEGSVAVVVPFCWRHEGHLRDGVLKVLKPGVETRLAQELALLPAIADLLERRSAELGLPAIDYRGPLASVQRLLREEIRLDQEQVHLKAAADFHADDARVRIPALLPWCTPRVTAMERVIGTELSAAPLSEAGRRQLAATMMSALLIRPFWSDEPSASFHGDLHGGNLLHTEDGRLAVLDWSLIAQVSKADREAMVMTAVGGISLDVARIHAGLRALGLSGLERRGVERIIERSLDRAVRRNRPIGFKWLLELMDDLALNGASGFDEALSVFRKSWLSLAGVIGDLGVDANPDLSLLNTGLAHLMAEWPRRLFAPPASRAFGTHLSNLDLMQLATSGWASSARYWSRLAHTQFGRPGLAAG